MFYLCRVKVEVNTLLKHLLNNLRGYQIVNQIENGKLPKKTEGGVFLIVL